MIHSLLSVRSRIPSEFVVHIPRVCCELKHVSLTQHFGISTNLLCPIITISCNLTIGTHSSETKLAHLMNL